MISRTRAAPTKARRLCDRLKYPGRLPACPAVVGIADAAESLDNRAPSRRSVCCLPRSCLPAQRPNRVICAANPRVWLGYPLLPLVRAPSDLVVGLMSSLLNLSAMRYPFGMDGLIRWRRPPAGHLEVDVKHNETSYSAELLGPWTWPTPW